MKQSPEKMFAIAGANAELIEEVYRQQGERDPLLVAACYFAISAQVAIGKLRDREQNSERFQALETTINEAMEYAREAYRLHLSEPPPSNPDALLAEAAHAAGFEAAKRPA